MPQFVIQGPSHPNMYRMSKICEKYGDVILSVYEDDIIDKGNYKIIKNTLANPRSRVNNSLPFQIRTTLSGLLEVKDSEIIKFRTDEYYSNIELLLNKKPINEKLISSNIFFLKSINSMPFAAGHISDHFWYGKTELLTKALILADNLLNNIYWRNEQLPSNPFELKYTNTLSIESFIFFCYLKSNNLPFEDGKKSPENMNKIMFTYCDVVDIDNMKPYEWKCAGQTYTNSDYLFNNGYNKSIRTINELL